MGAYIFLGGYRRSVLNPIEFVYIKFTQNAACPYTFPIPFGKVTPKDKNRFITNINSIEACIDKDGLLYAGYCEHLLLDILFGIVCEQDTPPLATNKSHCTDKLVLSATEYIASNIDRKILIDDVCHNLGTNASTLNFKFRRELGVSVGQYILNERINKAKKLLVSTTYNISQISMRCGFENVYYFSNTFKKHTGVVPSKYRAGE